MDEAVVTEKVRGKASEDATADPLAVQVQRLRDENETLRALLFLKNIQVHFTNSNEKDVDEPLTVLKGNVKTLHSLTGLMDQVLELRTMYLLTRAEMLTIRELMLKEFAELKEILRENN